MLQAYCKLIVALLAAGCVHGFVHAEIYYAAGYGHLNRRWPGRTGRRGYRTADDNDMCATSALRNQTPSSHSGETRRAPFRFPIRRPPTPLGPQSMGTTNAKRGPPPRLNFDRTARRRTAARPTTPKQRRHACVGSAWRVRSRLDCVSLPVTPGDSVHSAEMCNVCRETDMAVRSHIFAYRYGFVVACAPLLLSVEPSSSDVVGDVLICNESATLHGSMCRMWQHMCHAPMRLRGITQGITYGDHV